VQYIFWILLILLCGLLISSVDVKNKTDFWHRITLHEEFTASNKPANYQWNDYLAQEARLFAELQQVLTKNSRADAYRYHLESPINPLNHTQNWNRSFVLKPERSRGGIVMLHGLSDSPYSVRSLALHLQAQGFYIIAPRLPGHGTLPTGLLATKWEDWAAVTELAMQELRLQIGDNKPVYLLGYSTGAALAVNYALDAQRHHHLPAPEKLILLSPMFGVSKFASFSKSLELIGRLPLLGSKRWISLAPEYNPFKYNSFSVNAGWQAHRLTKYLRVKMQAIKTLNGLADFPPSIAFQSLVDSTVSTTAIAEHFFRLLPQNDNELIIFDINRNKYVAPLTRTETNEIFSKLFSESPADYARTIIGNRNADTEMVSEWHQPAGTLERNETPLPLEFPRGVYSLSHIALPFPITDPTFGLDPDEREFFGIRLGNLNLRGEKNTLIIAADANQRLNSNPFYAYMEQRIDQWLDIPAQPYKNN
jgi:alpha-beta hydrolase superfamily lysophospholipase